jgi:hypothetical protein
MAHFSASEHYTIRQCTCRYLITSVLKVVHNVRKLLLTAMKGGL